MKKIGVVLNSLNGAGAQKTLLTLASNIHALGAEVDCFIVNGQKNDYEVEAGLGAMFMEGNSLQEKQQWLKAYTAANTYDLIVTSQPEYYTSAIAGQTYCSVHHTPSSWNERPTWKFWRRYQWMKRDRELYQGKRLIALSEGIKEDLVNNLQCNAEDVIVINNPFDIEGIRARAASDDNLPDFEYIVYVASLTERKRHADLLEAFALLSNKSINLVLVGKGANERRLRKLAEKLNITSRVIFWGWDANPYRLVKHARLAMLASRAEGLPRVVVESMALQTPIVSTDCRSGPREVLTGVFAPFLVPVGDYRAMAKAMERALEDYPEIPEDFVARFDGQFIARQYLNL